MDLHSSTHNLMFINRGLVSSYMNCLQVHHLQIKPKLTDWAGLEIKENNRLAK
jgi:hypothetical protein